MRHVRLILGVLLFLAVFHGTDAVRAATKLLPEEEATVGVFERTAPAVVFIKNAGLQWDWLFNSVYEVPRGAGSGFIWDGQGHIVTNFHVVYQADRLEVTLSDKKTYDAKIVGLAPEYDLAVLKVDAPPELLKTIVLGSSKDLKVGQRALSIGNPFGLDYSLTTGVVSALGRSMPSVGGRNIYDVIQTDAAINPGNSGGPLLDSGGALIGVATMIYSLSGSSAGVGFAVPVDTVKRVVPQLIKYGHTKRASLGLELVPDSIRAQLGLPGAMILTVQPGGPADAAGLKGTARGPLGNVAFGDVIIAVDDAQVRDNEAFFKAIDSKNAGESVHLKYWRQRQVSDATVVMAEVP